MSKWTRIRKKGARERIIYVSNVEDYIVLANDSAEAERMRRSDEFRAYVVYTKKECDLLKGKPREVQRLCHYAKRLFEGSITDIRSNGTLNGGADMPAEREC